MTLIMIADTAIHNCSPMLGEFPGNPAWKMKDDDTDEEDSHFVRGDHSPSESYVLDQLLAPFVDIDVAEMADYLDIERCELGLIGDDTSWVDDGPELNAYGYLTDTVLELQHSNTEDDSRTETWDSAYSVVAEDHMYSAVSEDHMYSLSSRASSTETDSRATSTSGYSSGTESLVSNDDTPVKVLSVSRTATSLLTQSASSLLRQQARSLLKPRVVIQAEKASDVDGPNARREGRKRTRSKAAQATGNKKWSRMAEEEQKESIMELTDIISSQLGVRERLEAIRIINPHSTVSPTDGEFVIDMKPINDTRFNKLQKFVRLHADDVSVASTTSTAEQRTSPLPQITSIESEAVDQTSVSTVSKGGRKRKGRGGRREAKAATSQQLSREQQQRAKEIESGLFVNEVRVSVSHTAADEEEDDDDDDIDILD